MDGIHEKDQHRRFYSTSLHCPGTLTPSGTPNTSFGAPGPAAPSSPEGADGRHATQTTETVTDPATQTVTQTGNQTVTQTVVEHHEIRADVEELLAQANEILTAIEATLRREARIKSEERERRICSVLLALMFLAVAWESTLTSLSPPLQWREALPKKILIAASIFLFQRICNAHLHLVAQEMILQNLEANAVGERASDGR